MKSILSNFFRFKNELSRIFDSRDHFFKSRSSFSVAYLIMFYFLIAPSFAFAQQVKIEKANIYISSVTLLIEDGLTSLPEKLLIKNDDLVAKALAVENLIILQQFEDAIKRYPTT